MMRMTRNGVDGYEENWLGIWDDADPVDEKSDKYEQQENDNEKNECEDLKWSSSSWSETVMLKKKS